MLPFQRFAAHSLRRMGRKCARAARESTTEGREFFTAGSEFTQRAFQTISPDLIVRYFGKFGEMAQQSELERMISMNWDRQTHHTAGSSIDVVAAVDAQQLPAATLDKTSKTRGRIKLSYSDFKNARCAAGIGLRNIDGQTSLNSLVQIAQEFIHGLALGRATWNGRDFGPEAAFLRIMHNDFDLHVRFPGGTPPFNVSMNAGSAALSPAIWTGQASC
jgi:hypothetical protein